MHFNFIYVIGHGYVVQF